MTKVATLVLEPRLPVLGQAELRALDQHFDGTVFWTSLVGGPDNELVRDGRSRRYTILHPFDLVPVPAGVNDADATEIEPEWEGPEPLDPVGVQTGVDRYLVRERLVLFHVLFVVGSCELTGIGVTGGERDGVELVVPHHHLCTAGIDHGPDDLEGLDLLRSTIDEIANENGLALPTAFHVPIGPTALDVPEITEEAFEHFGTAVHIADDIESSHDVQFPTERRSSTLWPGLIPEPQRRRGGSDGPHKRDRYRPRRRAGGSPHPGQHPGRCLGRRCRPGRGSARWPGSDH